MRRAFYVVATALLASAMCMPGAAVAQEAVPSVEVRARFFHDWGAEEPTWSDTSLEGTRFGFGEEVRVLLEVTNTGSVALTNVSAGLEFARGVVTEGVHL